MQIFLELGCIGALPNGLTGQYYSQARDCGAGGRGGGMQFLTTFLDHRVTKSCNVT